MFGIYMKFPILCKINESHKSSISEVIDSKKQAYLNASQGFFLKLL